MTNRAMPLCHWPCSCCCYPNHSLSQVSETLRRSLSDWLDDMKLDQAGTDCCVDRYIDSFDEDEPLHEEVRSPARWLSPPIVRSGTIHCFY
jgi:hypothetical protein